MITKCAITVNEYREKVVPSMRKIHAIVIFVSYSINHLYKNCEPEQLFSPGRKTKKPPPATCRKRLNLQYF
ncbi:hypothetical protein HMPREF3207_04042 [Citrobacter koseri]|nr:hypothetical protein HMPREF3207_04042 [Citrobacter koseri]